MPSDAALYMTLAISDYDSGKISQALQEAKKGYSLEPNENTYYFLHQISNNLPLKLNFR